MRCFPRRIGDNWHAVFDHAGTSYTHSLRTKEKVVADARIALIRDILYRLEIGAATIPDGVEPKAFIVSGGRAVAEVKASPRKPKAKTLGEMFDAYFANLTGGHKDRSSLATEKIHAKHWKRILGEDRPVDALDVPSVQDFVDRRVADGVVRETISRELDTLGIVMNWAKKRKLSDPPTWRLRDLTLPKGRQKPPFMTWEQIERRIERGDLDADAQTELWECLWLDKDRTAQCLDWVRTHSKAPTAYPMFAFAAYTGARRSEMVRSERTDWDFDEGVVHVRQRKSDTSKEFTTREVPIHPDLAAVMTAWFSATPNAVYAIEDDGVQLRMNGATRLFRLTVDWGPWYVMRGWHVFRHSLASNMAAAGVDQRVIDATLGHSTDAMARRYRHLLPRNQVDAIRRAFEPE